MKKKNMFLLITVLMLISGLSCAEDKVWTYNNGKFKSSTFCFEVPNAFTDINGESEYAIALRSSEGDMFLAIILDNVPDLTLEILESDLDVKSEDYVAKTWGAEQNNEFTSKLISNEKLGQESIDYLQYKFDVDLAGEPYFAYHCFIKYKDTSDFCELKFLYPKAKTNFGQLCYERLIESISFNTGKAEDCFEHDGKYSSTFEESMPEITSPPDFDRSISISNEESELWIDAQKRLKLNATVTKLKEDAPDKTAFVWSVGSDKIASISSDGVVTGKKAGKTKITCSAKDNPDINTSVIITVRQPVTKLVSKDKTIVVHEGHAVEWRLEVQPEDASNTKMDYTTSNDKISIESFEPYGIIRGEKVGRAKVTAISKSNEKKTVTCDVIIEPEVPLTVTGLGYGIYQNTLLELTVANRSEALTIINFDYELTHYDFKGNEVYSGSFTLSKNTKIKPGKEEKISIGNVYGTSGKSGRSERVFRN